MGVIDEEKSNEPCGDKPPLQLNSSLLKCKNGSVEVQVPEMIITSAEEVTEEIELQKQTSENENVGIAKSEEDTKEVETSNKRDSSSTQSRPLMIKASDTPDEAVLSQTNGSDAQQEIPECFSRSTINRPLILDSDTSSSFCEPKQETIIQSLINSSSSTSCRPLIFTEHDVLNDGNNMNTHPNSILEDISGNVCDVTKEAVVPVVFQQPLLSDEKAEEIRCVGGSDIKHEAKDLDENALISAEEKTSKKLCNKVSKSKSFPFKSDGKPFFSFPKFNFHASKQHAEVSGNVQNIEKHKETFDENKDVRDVGEYSPEESTQIIEIHSDTIHVDHAQETAGPKSTESHSGKKAGIMQMLKKCTEPGQKATTGKKTECMGDDKITSVENIKSKKGPDDEKYAESHPGMQIGFMKIFKKNIDPHEKSSAMHSDEEVDDKIASVDPSNEKNVESHFGIQGSFMKIFKKHTDSSEKSGVHIENTIDDITAGEKIACTPSGIQTGFGKIFKKSTEKDEKPNILHSDNAMEDKTLDTKKIEMPKVDNHSVKQTGIMKIFKKHAEHEEISATGMDNMTDNKIVDEQNVKSPKIINHEKNFSSPEMQTVGLMNIFKKSTEIDEKPIALLHTDIKACIKSTDIGDSDSPKIINEARNIESHSEIHAGFMNFFKKHTEPSEKPDMLSDNTMDGKCKEKEHDTSINLGDKKNVECHSGTQSGFMTIFKKYTEPAAAHIDTVDEGNVMLPTAVGCEESIESPSGTQTNFLKIFKKHIEHDEKSDVMHSSILDNKPADEKDIKPPKIMSHGKNIENVSGKQSGFMNIFKKHPKPGEKADIKKSINIIGEEVTNQQSIKSPKIMSHEKNIESDSRIQEKSMQMSKKHTEPVDDPYYEDVTHPDSALNKKNADAVNSALEKMTTDEKKAESHAGMAMDFMKIFKKRAEPSANMAYSNDKNDECINENYKPPKSVSSEKNIKRHAGLSATYTKIFKKHTDIQHEIVVEEKSEKEENMNSNEIKDSEIHSGTQENTKLFKKHAESSKKPTSAKQNENKNDVVDSMKAPENPESLYETCCMRLAVLICNKAVEIVSDRTSRPGPPKIPPKPSSETIAKARAAAVIKRIQQYEGKRQNFGDNIPVGFDGIRYVDDDTESSTDYKDLDDIAFLVDPEYSSIIRAMRKDGKLVAFSCPSISSGMTSYYTADTATLRDGNFSDDNLETVSLESYESLATRVGVEKNFSHISSLDNSVGISTVSAPSRNARCKRDLTTESLPHSNATKRKPPPIPPKPFSVVKDNKSIIKKPFTDVPTKDISKCVNTLSLSPRPSRVLSSSINIRSRPLTIAGIKETEFPQYVQSKISEQLPRKTVLSTVLKNQELQTVPAITETSPAKNIMPSNSADTVPPSNIPMHLKKHSPQRPPLPLHYTKSEVVVEKNDALGIELDKIHGEIISSIPEVLTPRPRPHVSPPRPPPPQFKGARRPPRPPRPPGIISSTVSAVPVSEQSVLGTESLPKSSVPNQFSEDIPLQCNDESNIKIEENNHISDSVKSEIKAGESATLRGINAINVSQEKCNQNSFIDHGIFSSNQNMLSMLDIPSESNSVPNKVDFSEKNVDDICFDKKATNANSNASSTPRPPPRIRRNRSRTVEVVSLTKKPIEGIHRSQSLSEADIEKRRNMQNKRFNEKVELKVLYTTIRKDSCKSKDTILTIDSNKGRRSPSPETLSSRPLPPPPPPPRSRIRSRSDLQRVKNLACVVEATRIDNIELSGTDTIEASKTDTVETSKIDIVEASKTDTTEISGAIEASGIDTSEASKADAAEISKTNTIQALKIDISEASEDTSITLKENKADRPSIKPPIRRRKEEKMRFHSLGSTDRKELISVLNNEYNLKTVNQDLKDDTCLMLPKKPERKAKIPLQEQPHFDENANIALWDDTQSKHCTDQLENYKNRALSNPIPFSKGNVSELQSKGGEKLNKNVFQSLHSKSESSIEKTRSSWYDESDVSGDVGCVDTTPNSEKKSWEILNLNSKVVDENISCINPLKINQIRGRSNPSKIHRETSKFYIDVDVDSEKTFDVTQSAKADKETSPLPLERSEKSVQTSLETLSQSIASRSEQSDDTDELLDLAQTLKQELQTIIGRHKTFENDSDDETNSTENHSTRDLSTAAGISPKLLQSKITENSSTRSSTSELWTISSSDESDDIIAEEESASAPRTVIRKKKLFYIAQEIITSEESFVDALKLLNVDFRSAIEKGSKQRGSAVVPDEILNQILNHLPQLQHLSDNLLTELKDRIEHWGNIGKIADVIVKMGPFLKLYSWYIQDFESLVTLLDDSKKKYPLFGQIIKDFEASPRCNRLALNHYMLKPVQRIPQYRLLLQEYLHHLPKDSPDYEDTMAALQIVSEVANHANESMKQGDNFLKLISIQNSILGSKEIIKPGRIFLKEGDLMKLSRKVMQPRWFVLMNDALLYLTPVQQGLYRMNYELPLTGMKVSVPSQQDYHNEFSVITVTRSFSLTAKSQEERREWISALTKAIDDNASKRSTFTHVRLQQKIDGGVGESLDQDFVLGRNAPVWIPDARVTMCQLCTCEFTVTFRRHHCRACGKVICSSCSSNRTSLHYLENKIARVCDECFFKLEQGSEDFTESGEADSDNQHVTSKHVKYDSRGKRTKYYRPSVLKEVCANDKGSTVSGYLQKKSGKSWKRQWFVVKDKVLYEYKASEDVAALKSLPLLGFKIESFSEPLDGVDPSLLFQINHPGQAPVIFHADSVGSAERWILSLKEATILE